jgi:hypothetical protein
MTAIRASDPISSLSTQSTLSNQTNFGTVKDLFSETADQGRTGQLSSGTQTFQIANGKLHNTGIPAKGIPTVPIESQNKFQENNQKSLADGQFIGGDNKGRYKVYPNSKPLTNVPDISPRDAMDGSRPIERTSGNIIYTNGIETTPHSAADQAQTVANMTNTNVKVVYSNADAMKSGKLVNNQRPTDPAVLTMSKQIQDAIVQGKTIHLYGHSGGAATIRNALNDTKAQLRKDLGYNSALDYSSRSQKYQQHPQNKEIDAKIEKMFQNVKIETSGSPVRGWPVDGPKYVHWINKSDMVTTSGAIDGSVGTPGGKNSVNVYFTSGKLLDGAKSHELDRYLNVREDQGGFDKVYKANSGNTPNAKPTNVNVPNSWKNNY